MTSTPAGAEPTHAAALCLRGAAAPELLLVRTSNGASWTWPKGRIERRDPGPEAAAVREAGEESGWWFDPDDAVLLGTYLHPRQLPDGTPGDQVRTAAVRVEVPQDAVATGPGEPGRTARWVPLPAVAEALAEGRGPDEVALLLAALDLLDA